MQPSRQPGAIRTAVTLPRSENLDLVSRAGRPYRLFIAWPAEEAPAAGFPVIYLLDANAAFATMVEAMRMQSRHPEATGVEPAVIVGIGYPTSEPFDIARRTFDLTPPPFDRRISIDDPTGSRAVGGAPELLRFIAEEVVPVVEPRFAVDPNRRALFGHSFGGLFVLHALFSRPDLFAGYVAASPSIWWRDRAILAEEEAFCRRGSLPEGRLLAVMVGALEQAARSPAPADGRAPDLTARRMVDNARELAERLGVLDPARLAVHFHLLAEETHPSSLPVAISRSLRLVSAPRGEAIS